MREGALQAMEVDMVVEEEEEEEEEEGAMTETGADMDMEEEGGEYLHNTQTFKAVLGEMFVRAVYTADVVARRKG